MNQLTFSELFDIFHAEPVANFTVIAWDGDSSFTCIKDLYEPESEPVNITDLVRTDDNTEQIILEFMLHGKRKDHSYCDEFRIFLKTLFSSKALGGYLIWHESGGGHSFGITRISSEEIKSGFYWSEERDKWMPSGVTDLLTHCSPRTI